MPKSTQDDIHQTLKDGGFEIGTWGKKKAQKLRMPDVLKNTKKTLEAIKPLVERQIEEDQKTIADAYVALQRIEHGGSL